MSEAPECILRAILAPRYKFPRIKRNRLFEKQMREYQENIEYRGAWNPIMLEVE